MSERPGWAKDLHKEPSFSPEFDLDPRRTTLLIIDMQYLDAHPDYGLGVYLKSKYPEVFSYFFERVCKLVVPNHIRLLDFFRRNRLRVIHLTVGPELPDNSDFVSLRRKREAEMEETSGRPAVLFPVGSFEHGILEELKPLHGELVINKRSRGAFNSTAIDQILRNMGIEGLVIAGVATNACVETTARDAADRGYKCVLVDDGCATFTQAAHDATMRSFCCLFGKVMGTGEIIEGLSQKL